MKNLIIQVIIMAAEGKPRQYLTWSLNVRTDLCVYVFFYLASRIKFMVS